MLQYALFQIGGAAERTKHRVCADLVCAGVILHKRLGPNPSGQQLRPRAPVTSRERLPETNRSNTVKVSLF